LRALITGISGFVGSHLAEHLLATTDWEVSGTVYGKADNLAHIRHRLRLIPAELSQIEVMRFVVEETRPDYIFHLAAQPIPALSRLNPWFTLENNIRPQLNVLEVVAEAALPCRVLVVGSSEEYGFVLPADMPLSEDAPLRPNSAYGVSKVAQDLLGLQYWLSHGVETIRVRPFNHLGPRQRKGFVAPDFASQIAEVEAGLRPPLIHVGNLEVARDFSDVRDVVRGYVLALTQGAPGEVYNLGSERATTIGTLLHALLALSRERIEILEDAARMRRADVPSIVSDCARLRSLTGWRAEIPLERSLQDVLNYWRDSVRTSTPDPAATGPVSRGVS
jgi:GDP-4-dehydro-6-deoxy-D-mannose reductase